MNTYIDMVILLFNLYCITIVYIIALMPFSIFIKIYIYIYNYYIGIPTNDICIYACMCI